jgi:hypothetical protein
MSLEVKRAVKAVEDQLPEKKSTLNEIAGCEIDVEINWDTFTTKDDVVMIPNAFFDRFNEDLKKICSDDLGKEAVQEAIKKIVVEENEANQMNFDKANGTLTIKGKWSGSPGRAYPSYGDYKKEIEANL